MIYLTDEQASEKLSRFQYDLLSLLDKYKAEITIEDYWTGYSECGRDLHIVVELKGCHKLLEFDEYIDKDTKGKIE